MCVFVRHSYGIRTAQDSSGDLDATELASLLRNAGLRLSGSKVRRTSHAHAHIHTTHAHAHIHTAHAHAHIHKAHAHRQPTTLQCERYAAHFALTFSRTVP